MKTIGMILIGATVFMAGCACDCEDRMGATGQDMDNNSGMVETYDGAEEDGYTANSGADNGSNNGTTRGNTSTNNNGDGYTQDDNTDGRSATSPTDPNKNIKPKNDPRKYNQTSGGVGYRTDTLDEYDGIDGSARDKGDMDEVPNP